MSKNHQENTSKALEKLQKLGIRVLFFDIGEVLVHVNKQFLIEKIKERSSLDEATLIERILGDGNMVLSHIGEITDEAYFKHLVELTEYSGTPAEMKRHWQDMLELLKERVAEQQTLAQNYPCGIISNITPYHVEAVENRWDLGNGFRWVIYSCDVGYVKPRKEIYEIALQQSGYTAEECFFWDDRADNVETARELGFHAEQIFPEDTLEACILRHE